MRRKRTPSCCLQVRPCWRPRPPQRTGRLLSSRPSTSAFPPQPRLAGHVATGRDHLVLQALHLATRLVCRTCWPACRGPRGRKPASPTPPPFATAKLLLVPGWQEVEGAQAVSFHWLVKEAIKVQTRS